MSKTINFRAVLSEGLRGQKSYTSNLPPFSRQVAQVRRSKPSVRPLSNYPRGQKRGRPQLSLQFGERARKMSRVPIESQRVDAPLTQSATFVVVSIEKVSSESQSFPPAAIKTIRSALASLDDLAKNVSSEYYHLS